MADQIRGLSLHQPWASLVAWGEKRVETRNWSSPYRGRLATVSAPSGTTRPTASAGSSPTSSPSENRFPCRGVPGLWTVPDEIVAAIEAQFQAVPV